MLRKNGFKKNAQSSLEYFAILLVVFALSALIISSTGSLSQGDYTNLNIFAGMRDKVAGFFNAASESLTKDYPMGHEDEWWNQGSGSGCFVAGTLVTMGDGSQKRIEEVIVGEVLLGMNNSKNKVVELKRRPLGGQSLYSINSGNFFVNASHPFMTTNGWKSIDPASTLLETPSLAVSKLTKNEKLILKDGSLVEIQNIDERQDNPDQTIYNFTLSGNNTYYANGYLVHNKPGEGYNWIGTPGGGDVIIVLPPSDGDGDWGGLPPDYY